MALLTCGMFKLNLLPLDFNFSLCFVVANSLTAILSALGALLLCSLARTVKTINGLAIAKEHNTIVGGNFDKTDLEAKSDDELQRLIDASLIESDLPKAERL